MKRFAAVAALLVGLATNMPAAELSIGSYVGQVYSGYTWRGDYWYRGGVPYECYRSTVTTYDKYNCPHTSYSYDWREYKKAKPEIDPYADDALSKLLDIADKQQAWVLSDRSKAQKFNQFKEAVVLLGMEGQFRVKNYGEAIYSAKGFDVPSPYGNQYGQLAAPQGNTVYGYNFGVRETADFYGNNDLGAIYKQALRLRSDSRALEAEGDRGTTQLVDNLGKRAAIIAEIRANGVAAAGALVANGQGTAQALNAAKAQSRTEITREVYGSGTGGGGTVPVAPPPGGDEGGGAATGTTLQKAQQLVNQKCLSCHSATKKNGDLDVTDLRLLSPDQVDSIMKRVVDPDPQKRMPIKADLSPGTPLTHQELGILFRAVDSDQGK